MSAQIKGITAMKEALPIARDTIFAREFTSRLCEMIEEAEHRHDLGIRAEISAPEGNVYVRVSRRRLEDREQRVIYIARIEIEPAHRRRGLFNEIIRRASLCAVMYSCALYVENVMNDHIERSLPRHGFKHHEYSVPPSFYKTVTRLREEHREQMDSFVGMEPISHED